MRAFVYVYVYVIPKLILSPLQIHRVLVQRGCVLVQTISQNILI